MSTRASSDDGPLGKFGPCEHCDGDIGPDITDRPMCYGCGPDEMLPAREREEREREDYRMLIARDVASCVSDGNVVLASLRRKP